VSAFGFLNLVVLPIGFGLFGFVEPCSIGTSVVMVKYLEGKNTPARLAQIGMFAATRALFLGAMGVTAALVGSVFLGFQRGAWIFLGMIYLTIGALYILGKARLLMASLGPGLSRISGLKGSVGLGLLFGLNVPACAVPLLLALLGTAATGGGAGGTLAAGFISLGLFGLALSLPLVLAVLFKPARRALDWTAGLSTRLPLWTGLVLIALGLWSIGFGLFVDIRA
jgi:cytochrome c-type biogenesis protein